MIIFHMANMPAGDATLFAQFCLCKPPLLSDLADTLAHCNVVERFAHTIHLYCPIRISKLYVISLVCKICCNVK